MDYKAFKNMIIDSGVETTSLKDIPNLREGVVFIPSRQIGDWKAFYLVVAEKEGFFLCVRLNSYDESLSGTYDIMAEGYIIETWNAIMLPKESEIRGYAILPDSILRAVLEVRETWMKGEIPNADYPTGGDILSSPDRVLFHEAELQANESLQKAWNEGTDQFKTRALWESLTKDQDISDAFGESEGLTLNGHLSAAVFPPQYIVFSWEAKEETPPPEVYIRYTGNAWIASSDWKEVKTKKRWRFAATIPESARALVLRIGQTECVLEVSPSDQKIASESLCSLALFQAYEKAEFDPATEMSKELLEYRFSSLEMQALKQGRVLNQPHDQICFFVAFALCSDLISRITRLYLFQWVEKKLSRETIGSEGKTVFGRDILSKLQTFKEGGYAQVEWFYKAVYQTWHNELTKWKGQIDKTMYYEVEEIEEAVGDLLVRYESWQNRLTVFSEGLLGKFVGKWTELIFETSTPYFLLQTSHVPQKQLQDDTDDTQPDIVETNGIMNVEILDPDEWYGIFSHPENEDDDMKEFLNALANPRIRADYYWGGLKVIIDGTSQLIVDNVVKSVPDISDPDIEPSAAEDSVLLLVGVSRNREHLKSVIERFNDLKDHDQGIQMAEKSQTNESIAWISYSFSFNIPE